MTQTDQTDVTELTLKPLAENIRILSGKIPGQEARRQLHLDALDKSPGRVRLNIPVAVVTSSFCLGLLAPSVENLGVERFFDKYEFSASPSVVNTIRENIEFAAAEGDALE